MNSQNRESQVEIILIEPGSGGHRLEFLQFASSLAISAGLPVTIVTSQAAVGAVEAMFPVDSVRIVAILGRSPSVRSRVSDFGAILKVGRGQGRMIILNVGEWLVPLMLLSLRRRLSAISAIQLRPAVGGAAKARLKRGSEAWLRWRGATILSLRSPLETAPVDPTRSCLDPSGLSPGSEDSGSELLAAIERWKDGHEAPVVAVVGGIDSRKNVDRLAACAQSSDIRLLLVGAVDGQFRERLSGSIDHLPQTQVFLHPARVTEGELDGVIARADAVALLYANKSGSSGIVARCLRIGTPIVGSGNETVLRAADLGAAVAVNDLRPDALASAIRSAVSMQPERVNLPTVQSALASWEPLLSPHSPRL